MNKAYLLTIVDISYNEYSDQTIFHSVYVDKGLAQHYMLKDITEQLEKGRIKNIDGLDLNKDVYINNNITWRIEEVSFISGVI